MDSPRVSRAHLSRDKEQWQLHHRAYALGRTSMPAQLLPGFVATWKGRGIWFRGGRWLPGPGASNGAIEATAEIISGCVRPRPPHRILRRSLLESDRSRNGSLHPRMGQTVCIRCRNCDDQTGLTTGVGFGGFSLETSLVHASKATRAEVRKLLKRHPVHSTDYGFRLFECPRCDSVHSRFHIRVEYGEGQLYELKFRCSRCRKSLVPAQRSGDWPNEYMRQLESYACRKCGARKLVQAGVGHWD